MCTPTRVSHWNSRCRELNLNTCKIIYVLTVKKFWIRQRENNITNNSIILCGVRVRKKCMFFFSLVDSLNKFSKLTKSLIFAFWGQEKKKLSWLNYFLFLNGCYCKSIKTYNSTQNLFLYIFTTTKKITFPTTNR